MRPNLFANTPDILHEYLQHGGRPAFQVRLILAATLGATYGIYSGYELAENVPVKPGSEEYLDSEKYQIRLRNYDDPDSLAELIRRINAIRRDHPALQRDRGLRFHHTDNPQHHLLQQALAGRLRPDPGGRQPGSAPHAARLRPACRSATGACPTTPPSRSSTCSRPSATTGAASGTTSASIRRRASATSSRCRVESLPPQDDSPLPLRG